MSDAEVPVPPAEVDSRYTAPAEENPHAGRGTAVMLDIGGDIGAVVLTLPDDLVGREIEVVPVGSRGPGGKYEHAPADHAHDDGSHAHGDHEHDHEHDERDHEHEDAEPDHHGGFHASHQHPAGTPPHVGVVARPIGDRMVPTAVFGDLVQGRYEFALRPFHGVVDLEVDVVGGEVAMADWPGLTR